MEDAIAQSVGPQGEVVLSDSDGYALGVAGSYGAGRVVCIGAVLGIEVTKQKDDSVKVLAKATGTPSAKGDAGKEIVRWAEAAHSDGRRALLLNTIRWLGQERDLDLAAATKALPGLAAAAAEEMRRWECRLQGLADRDSRVKDADEVQAARQKAAALLKERRDLLGLLNDETGGVDEATLPSLASRLADHPIQTRKALRDALLNLGKAIRDAREELALKPRRGLPRFFRGFSVQYFDVRASLEYLAMMFEDIERTHANFVAIHYHWVKDYPHHFRLADLHGMQMEAMTGTTTPENVADLMGKFMPHSSFTAYHLDEPGIWPKHCFLKEGGDLHPGGVGLFQKYLAAQFKEKEFTRGEVEAFLRAVSHGRRPKLRFLNTHPVLWHFMGKYLQERVYEKVSACGRKAKEMDPDLAFKVLLTPICLAMPYLISSPTSLAPLGDIVACDVYSSGGYGDRLIMEMMRAAGRGTAKRTVLWNGWRNRSPYSYRRSCLVGLMHADGVLSFTLGPFYKKRNRYGDGWKYWCPGGYEVAQEVFGLAEKAEDYLVPSRSLAQTALLVSERTMWNHHYHGWGGMPNNMFYSQLSSIYSQLLRSHLLIDVVWAEHLEKGELNAYKVLIAPEVASMTDAEVRAVSEWVERGGRLVATARTSACDAYGRLQTEYGLAKTFGVHLKGPVAKGHRVRLKEFLALKQRKLVRSADHPVVAFLSKEPAPYSGERFGGVYEHDVIEALDGTEVLARWDAESPVITVARVGKGACVFTAAQWLGLCPGANEFWGAAARWCLEQAGSSPVAVLGNASPQVEVNVRQKADGTGLALHLFDHDEAYTIDKSRIDPKTTYHVMTPNPTSGVIAKIRLPEAWKGKKVHTHDPVGNRDLSASVQDGRIVIEIPDFVMYQLITIRAE